MNPKNKYGFTLIELIVVLAILSIVAAIAVPTAFGSIENAREKACKANEDNILSAWRVEDAAEEVAATSEGYTARSQTDILNAALANCGLTQTGNKITDLCPSGGTYMLAIIDGALEIRCNVHDTPTSTTMADPKTQERIYEALQAISATKVNSIDYGAASNSNSYASKLTEELRKNGLDISDIKINGEPVTAWCVANAGAGQANQFYFTACDVSNLAVGTMIPVIMYIGSTNTFRVYNAPIKLATYNGETYNTIDQSNVKTVKWDPADYAAAEKAYLSSSFFQ